MSETRDYLALRTAEPTDKMDHGVMGMRWGRRRSDAQIKADTSKRAASGEKVTPTAKAKTVLADKPAADKAPDSAPTSSGPETSQARYARIQAISKNGGASGLDDADLKFFNARTEAIAKINKLNQDKPGWLSETTKKVLQTAGQNAMQSVADTVLKKYGTGPLTDAITGKVTDEKIKAESKTPPDYIGRHRAKPKK